MRFWFSFFLLLVLCGCGSPARRTPDARVQEIGRWVRPDFYHCKELKVYERGLLKMRDETFSDAEAIENCRPAVECAFAQGEAGVPVAELPRMSVPGCSAPATRAVQALVTAELRPETAKASERSCYTMVNLAQRLGLDFGRTNFHLYKNFQNSGRGCDFVEWSNPKVIVVDMPTCGNHAAECHNTRGNPCYVCGAPEDHEKSAQLCRTKVESRFAVELWCDLTHFKDDIPVNGKDGKPGQLLKAENEMREKCVQSIKCRAVSSVTPATGNAVTGGGNMVARTDSFYAEGEAKLETRGGVYLAGAGKGERVNVRLQGNRRTELNSGRFGGPLWVNAAVGENGGSMETSGPLTEAVCAFEVTGAHTFGGSFWGEMNLTVLGNGVQGRLSGELGKVSMGQVNISFNPLSGGGKSRAGLHDMCVKSHRVTQAPVMRDALNELVAVLNPGKTHDIWEDGVSVSDLGIEFAYKSSPNDVYTINRIRWRLVNGSSGKNQKIEFTYNTDGLLSRLGNGNQNPRVTEFLFPYRIGRNEKENIEGYSFERAWMILAGYDRSGAAYFNENKNLIAAMVWRLAELENSKAGHFAYPESWIPVSSNYGTYDPCPANKASCTSLNPIPEFKGEKIKL